jgi:acylaminoacyl-peptidase
VAGTRRNIKLDDLFRLRVVSKAAISPDAGQVAVAVGRCDFKKNKNFSSLYLASARGGRLRRLTTGDHGDGQPKWSPDGKVVAFLSDREKAACIWLLSMEGGEPIRLTDRDHDVFDFCFSPNGKRIVYAARAKSETDKLRRDGKNDVLETRADYRHITRLFHKFDGSGFWNGNYVHLHSISVRGGRATQLTRGDYDHASPQFSPDGKTIAFLSNRMADPDRHIENADLCTISPAGGRVRQITKREGAILNFSWSPDGRQFAFIGNMSKQGGGSLHHMHVWTIPARGGTARNLTPDVDNNCYNMTIGDVAEVTFGADPPLWSADGGGIFFAVSERGSCNLYEVPVRRGKPQPRLVGDHVVIGMSRTAAAGRAALVIGTALDPADVFTLDVDNPHDEPRRITNVNRQVLSKIRLSTPEPVACRRTGHTVHGWVIRPPGFSAKRKYPMVLQIHGGPYGQYGHTFFHEMQLLAARGYVVLYTNPRGSAGYGLKYLTRLRHDWGGPDTPDVLACVDQVARHRFIDKKRLYIAGGSYGGFMTNWIIARDHRFRAAITQRCVYNMESMLASDYGSVVMEETGCPPWKDPKRFRRLSPHANVSKINTPLLIIHSEQDLRCPIGQAEEMFTTLKWLRKEVEFVRFAGESHGLSRGGRPQNRAERLRRILDWFARYK